MSEGIGLTIRVQETVIEGGSGVGVGLVDVDALRDGFELPPGRLAALAELLGSLFFAFKKFCENRFGFGDQ